MILNVLTSSDCSNATVVPDGADHHHMVSVRIGRSGDRAGGR